MEKSSPAGTGISSISLLTIVFIVLKLTHVIDWSWSWVLAPIWISMALSIAIIIGLLVIVIITKWS